MAPIVVDFTNTKDSSGVNPKHQPEGDYHGKIVKATQGKSKSNNNPMVEFLIQDVNMGSATYPYRCVLTEASLWKLRNLILATGKAVPKKRIKFDPDTIVGKEIGMTLEDDEYDGKMKSVISAVFPASDLPEEEPARKSTKKAAPEPEDDEDDDDEDEEEEAPPAKKTRKKAAKPAADEDDDEAEDLDELDIDDL